MNPVVKLLKAAYLCYFYLTFSIALLLLYPLILILLKSGRRFYPAVHTIRKYGCRFVLFITGISYEIQGELKIPQKQACLICTNHTSVLDIIIPIAAFDFYHHYMGKHELANIPFFGTFFKYMDIPVYRTGNTGLYKSYQQAATDLKRNIPLVIFPEGTTSTIAPQMLRFKKGAFKLAVESNVPLIPVIFLDHWHMMHYDKFEGKPGRSRIIVGEAIHPTDNSEEEIDRLKSTTREKMEEIIKYHEAVTIRFETRNNK